MSDIKWVGKPFKLEGKSESESEWDQCGHFLHITMKPKKNWNRKNRSVQCGHTVKLQSFLPPVSEG